MSITGEAAKRTTDLLIAVVLVVLLVPLFLIVALAIKLDDGGPILFRQQRLGRGGEPFLVLKFRTMQVDAPAVATDAGDLQTREEDPRVTAVGSVLRRTSLDELPQLLNVIAGHMSLVGPRPDPVACLDHYRPQDFRRLTVRPGITGWAAVNGRNAIPLDARRDLDLEYVGRRSLTFDLMILIRTVGVVVGREGIDVVDGCCDLEPPPRLRGDLHPAGDSSDSSER